MTARFEFVAFGIALAAVIAVPLGPALIGDRVLSPSDLAYVQRTFDREKEPSGFAFEPSNRLLTDPMLQFEPWITFNREIIRSGRLPLWNDRAGCGVPHLANGQSAVFDPIAAIAYVGTMPDALAWIAAARLWIAGLGMYVLAHMWGLGFWGRWFAGLVYPLCGFMTLWLLYPLASVAAWLPWLIVSTEWLIRRRGTRPIAAVAASASLVILGGHIQTGAHCFMLSLLYFLVRSVPGREGNATARSTWKMSIAWGSAMLLGITTASVAILPLGFYLARSPAWEDRTLEKGSPWTLAQPRLLEAATTAFPNLYGNQRRGQPNLARALGLNNQNEAAGGFAGLGTLIWLAPVGSVLGRGRVRTFLLAAVGLGICASFRLPPIDNLLRALPVLDVTDHRRMTLWIAFGLVGLGAIGLDRLAAWKRSKIWCIWIGLWVIAAGMISLGATALPLLEPTIRDRAMTHYAEAAEQSADLGPDDARILSERQVRNLMEGYRSTLWMSAALLGSLAVLALTNIAQGGRAVILGIVLFDLIASMWGANPTIARNDFLPESPVIAHLRREAAPPNRVLSVGMELPPNMLMRYGLADLRCYDAIELASISDWLAPMYESTEGRVEARSSRRTITWEGVARARDRLLACHVVAVVGATPPPEGLFDRVVAIGQVWVGHWNLKKPNAEIIAMQGGRITVDCSDSIDQTPHIHEQVNPGIQIPVVYVPGWRAWCAEGELQVLPGTGPFLEVSVPDGVDRIELKYDPPEVRWAIGGSLLGLTGIVLLAGPWSVKNRTNLLGPARRLALESIPMVTGDRLSDSSPQVEGYNADGPLHV
ncbi:glycosyltransferase family protein [Tautonia rosea]|uniref:hypothetical protein n=1 Tax=Tautonia rosea TaxID=2728037 RepID=UPI001473BB01|nr:hypothetical protein [Tautonia rosea]